MDPSAAPTAPENIVVTLGLVVLLAGLASCFVTIWYRTRRHPPVEELVEREVAKVETRLEARLTRIEKKVDSIPGEQSARRGEMYKHFEAEIKDVYRRQEQSQAETRDLITQLTQTVNKSFQDLQRDIGRIEARGQRSESRGQQ